MWRNIRFAAKLTQSQQLELANKHWAIHGDTTEHALDLTSEDSEGPKYSLRRLVNKPDYDLEGRIQDNCIGLYSSFKKAADVFSVRDEDNLPVVSMRMRRRSNDDWFRLSNLSDESRNTVARPEHFDFHNTGNDVLVVDEAVQKGNAPIDKYIRPALSAMVQYARQHNIPNIAYSGTARISSQTNLISTDDVERLLNEQEEEAPDYLYVSYLKGLRKPDGTLPVSVSVLNEVRGFEPLLVHQEPTHPSMSGTLKVWRNDIEAEPQDMAKSDFYETARVPFSSKRFERKGGFTSRVNVLFGRAANILDEVGWKIREHNTELKRSLLNDIVHAGASNVESQPFGGHIVIPRAASPQDVLSKDFLDIRSQQTDESSLKQEFIHPTTVPSVEMRGHYVKGLGYVQHGNIVHKPVVYGQSFSREQFDYNYKTPVFVATPSSLRDQPLLFDAEGLKTDALYKDNRRGNKEDRRSGFVGAQRNDIWQVDTTRLPPNVLGHFLDGGVSFISGAVIPYDALSLVSQSEMNKRKTLPTLGRKCMTCDSDWGDEHEGHESKMVNKSHRPLPEPEKFEYGLPSLSADEVKALNAGTVPDRLYQIDTLRNLVGRYGVIDDRSFRYCDGGQTDGSQDAHISVPFQPEVLEDATLRGFYSDNYATYASGALFPKKKRYAFKDNLPDDLTLPVEVHNWKPVEVPEKFYFSVPSQARRDPAVYAEGGVSITGITPRNTRRPNWSSQPIENNEHDIWSIDINHPSIRESLKLTYGKTWSLDGDINYIPYAALNLERRGDDAVIPHVRQFFSKVAQYLTDGETSGGWVSEYWGQSGSVSAPTTADPNQRKRPNGSLWTQIGDNGIDEPAYIQQLMQDPEFKDIVMDWQGLFKNIFSPNRPGINSYSSTDSLRVRQMRGWKNR